jgi:RNA-binding protein YhbY
MKTIAKFQIGKFGVTPGVIESLELALKNHKQIRISVLKASGRTRENIEQMAQDITSKLKEKCACKIIGFTIVLIKLGSAKPILKKTKSK